MGYSDFFSSFYMNPSAQPYIDKCRHDYENVSFNPNDYSSHCITLDELSENLETGRLSVEVDGVVVDAFLNINNSAKLYVFLGGGIAPNDELPHFDRWSYLSAIDDNCIFICDPMLLKYKEEGLLVGWYYGTDKSYLFNIRDLVLRIAKVLNICNDDIVFYGSSAGGYASLFLSSIVDGSSCISINPQINLSIQRDWDNSIQMERITQSDLSSDDFRNDLRKQIVNGVSKRMIIVANSFSSSDMKQVKSLCDYMDADCSYGLNKLSDNIILWLYDALNYRNDSAHEAQELKSILYSIIGLLDIDLVHFDVYKKIYFSISLMWSELYKKYRDCKWWINKAETLEKNNALPVCQDILRRVINIQDGEYYRSKRNSISSVQTDCFLKYKNSNFGKEVALVATGPSLNNYVPIQGVKYCGVNKAFLCKKIQLDYLFMLDYNAVKDYIRDAKDYPCDKFYGLVRDMWESCIIPEDIAIEADAKRFYLEGIKNPIHYTLDICNEPLGDCGSVVYSAMQFLLYTNPKTIYLIGCDCTSNGYFDTQKPQQETGIEVKSYFYDGWVAMKKFAEINYPGIRIVSVNPVGLKGVFEDYYQ